VDKLEYDAQDPTILKGFLPTAVIPENASINIPDFTTKINKDAFKATGAMPFPERINHLTFASSNTLTEIGASAFENCTNLSGQITFPTSLTAIGSNAFTGCSAITAIDLSNCALTSGSGTEGQFENCTSLTSVNLPGSFAGSLSPLPAKMFSGCTNLRSLTLNSPTVVAYGSGVFSGAPIVNGYGIVYVPLSLVSAYRNPASS
jgi:Leucine-rich repeat (LRR) protein